MPVIFADGTGTAHQCSQVDLFGLIRRNHAALLSEGGANRHLLS